VDLRQLSYFVAVAEELSFSRGALRVHISQPPLSRQIARLEQDLGAKLLIRSSHEVILTEAGKALLVEARSLLAQSKTIGDVVRRAERGEAGSLRIGFVGSTIYTSLPTLLSQYRLLYPDVEVSVKQLTVARQTELLRSGDIDVGIIRQAIADTRLSTRSLFKEPFMAALPVHHRLAGREKVSLPSLAEERFVIFSREEAPAIHGQLSRMCEVAGFSPRIAQEAYPMSTVVGLVAAGVGIALVPASMQRLQVQGVVYRHLSGTTAKTEFFLAWRSDNNARTLKNFLAMKMSLQG
jgi:DNA-binding transcriptional LysR family regulator